MIDLAVAATVAALLNNSVSAIDKVYNWVKARKGEKPASLGLRNDPQKEVLQYISLSGKAEPPQVVLTYEQLAERLTDPEVDHVKSFEMRMSIAMKQWNALNAELPLSDPVGRARIEANMEMLVNRDICASLTEIVGFIDSLGIDLCDHYREVRRICK